MQNDSFSQTCRQNWMAVLSKANWTDLKPLWDKAPHKPDCHVIREPETGMVMVRGRMGGSGQPFNTGEATVTRCSVQSRTGLKGHAYVLGRNKDHALAAAELDAGLQEPSIRSTIIEHVIEPLKRVKEENLEKHRRQTAATKVDFFTLVRGEVD